MRARVSGLQLTPYALVSLAVAVVSAGLAVRAWRRRDVPGARMGALFMAGVAFWGAAGAVELVATDLTAKVFWAKVTYLGIVVVPFAWWGFAAGYTGRERWLTPRNLTLLAVPPALTLALVFTNEAHGLIWRETTLVSSGPLVAVDVVHGLGFWAWCAYAYALLLAGGALVVTMLVRSGDLYTKQGWALMFGMLAPWLGNALYLSGLFPVPGLDPTPFFFLITGAATALATSRFGLLDVVPVARAAVVEGLEDGVIVLDDRDRVLDLNAAAGAVCKLPPSEAVGLPADRVVSSPEILREIQAGADGVRRQVVVADGPAGRHAYEATFSSLGKGGSKERPRARRRGRIVVVRDVTERVEAEEAVRRLNAKLEAGVVERTRELWEAVEALRENEERYRRLNEAAFEGLAIHEGGLILEANDAIAKMFGYESAGEFVGTHALDHVAPESREVLRRNMTSGFPGTYEAVGTRKDGQRILVEIRGAPSRYRAREVRLAAMRDVTAERAQESALKASEAKYRAIFENSAEGIFQSTPDGRLVTANPAMARIFGHESAAALISSTTDTAALLCEDGSEREAFLSELRREDSVSGFEARASRRDGSVVWTSVSARLLRDAGGDDGAEGRVSGYEGTVQDVTERVEARRTLERRIAALTRVAASLAVDQPMRVTLDSLAAGVVETTGALASSVRLIDPKTRALLLTGSHGLPDGHADAARDSWRGGVPAEHTALSAFESQKPALVRQEPPPDSTADGVARGAPYVVPLVAHGQSLGTICLYYPQDTGPTEDETTFIEAVADQAALALENSRLYSAAQGAAALRERQRLSRELHDSVSQALYGIALGSRTARTLLDRGDPSRAAEPIEYVLSLAEAGLAEMRALIFALRPEALESEGLVSALERSAASIEARHGISVRAELPDEPDVSPEAKEALYRIAQEAMHNAVKHSGARNLDLSVSLEGDAVLLSVGDDGAGFDPSGSFPGHLGLRSMRERAERLGGALRIESAPGEGARVLARIPR